MEETHGPHNRKHHRTRFGARLVAASAFIIVAAFAAAAPHALSSSSSQRGPISPRDSAVLHAQTVSAFRNFQYRYYTFVWGPLNKSDWIQDPETSCEVRVGDFCYGPTNGRLAFGGLGTTRAYQALREATSSRMYGRMTNAYLSVYMNELRSALQRIPGDRWMVGEIVRLQIDLGLLGRAEDELKDCRADAWWCSSLRAHLKYIVGDWTASDSLWDVALKALPPEERCAWLNPASVLRDTRTRRALNEMTCDDRARIAERAWWLSDPFFTRPGNERRSAHLSRIVNVAIELASFQRAWATPAMMRENVVAPMGLPLIPHPDVPLMRACLSYGSARYAEKWSSRGIIPFLLGYPELVMRVGPPFHCADKEANRGYLRADIFVQYPTHRYAFVPAGRAMMSHLHATASDWGLNARTQFEFISEWTRAIHDVTHQAAYFRRGDSLRLVVASDAPPSAFTDSDGNVLPAPPHMSGTLWWQEDFDRTPITTESQGTSTIVFAAQVPPRRSLASVELHLPRGAMGRTRFGTGPQTMPAQRLGISDVLLTHSRESLPASLQDAEPQAKGSHIFQLGATAGLFWEVYGLRPGDTTKTSLLVMRQRGEQPVRAGRTGQQVAGVETLVIEWNDPPSAGRVIEPRALNVSLAGLRRGRYTLSVAVSVAGQQLVESVRTIEIVR